MLVSLESRDARNTQRTAPCAPRRDPTSVGTRVAAGSPLFRSAAARPARERATRYEMRAATWRPGAA
ncbi:hypothetical protein CUJ89_21075 [Burkholderia pyrrocinia]|uniref:Uncharacterized protein n=1 Tax=Burkholderia pyrrocinia TaxID=60550 RepID=A0A2Z5N051_BURPY|nr:hypothetical protein CUJ89_21075 [Burkholderia pyrrocinia]